jgi:hypothetical protein
MPHDGTVLAVRLMPGNHLFGIEPALTPYCGPNCDFAVQLPAWVWHVTVFDRTLGRVRTFVIDDAEFGDQGPVTMQEPTVDGVVEHAETAAAPVTGMVLGMRPGAYPYLLEEVDLPVHMP